MLTLHRVFRSPHEPPGAQPQHTSSETDKASLVAPAPNEFTSTFTPVPQAQLGRVNQKQSVSVRDAVDDLKQVSSEGDLIAWAASPTAYSNAITTLGLGTVNKRREFCFTLTAAPFYWLSPSMLDLAAVAAAQDKDEAVRQWAARAIANHFHVRALPLVREACFTQPTTPLTTDFLAHTLAALAADPKAFATLNRDEELRSVLLQRRRGTALTNALEQDEDERQLFRRAAGHDRLWPAQGTLVQSTASFIQQLRGTLKIGRIAQETLNVVERLKLPIVGQEYESRVTSLGSSTASGAVTVSPQRDAIAQSAIIVHEVSHVARWDKELIRSPFTHSEKDYVQDEAWAEGWATIRGFNALRQGEIDVKQAIASLGNELFTFRTIALISSQQQVQDEELLARAYGQHLIDASSEADSQIHGYKKRHSIFQQVAAAAQRLL